MSTYRSPGVYVEEISLLPPSIAEVESAVPAFVGYTEKAKNLIDDDLLNVPTTINGLSDYLQFFGGSKKENAVDIDIAAAELKSGANTTGVKVTITLDKANMNKYNLYHAIKLYFANGGGRCYIVSVGKYAEPDAINVSELSAGLDLVAQEDTPTILVVPDAVSLAQSDFDSINQKMLKQASDLKDRFAVLDTLITTVPKTPGSVTTDVATAITNVPADGAIREYGAVYYPHLETSYPYEFDFDALTLTTHTVNGAAPAPADDKTGTPLGTLKNTASLIYNAIVQEYGKYHKILPPSAAMAGVYARVDRERGVWKAPANVGLMDVVKPMISVSRSEHDLLNINTDTGKSVDAILSMPGYGTVVMGGRTLNGNDNEWKYINVRRFFSVVEESVKKSTAWVIFEPNTAATWVKVQAMIENYLFLKWRDGALAGAKPDQAYFVRVGLGSTMNDVDILEGRMIVEIGMAVARPAEFIILRFEQKIQES